MRIWLIGLTLLFGCGEPAYRQGASLYERHCANCHMDRGQGLGELYPPLAGSDWLRDRRDEAICAIRHGLEGPIVVNDTIYNQVMPGEKDLSEVQITNLINYLNQAWGNNYGTTTVAEVKNSLETCR